MFCFNSEKMLWRFKKFYPNKVLKYAFLLFDSVKGSQEFFSKSVISLAKTSSRLVHFEFLLLQFRSVTQTCPTICDPMDCSTPDFRDHHHLLELAQTHVCQVGDAIQSYLLSSLSPPAFSPSQHQGLFPVSQFFASGGQSIGASASASVLAVNIQD